MSTPEILKDFKAFGYIVYSFMGPRWAPNSGDGTTIWGFIAWHLLLMYIVFYTFVTSNNI